MAEIVRMPKLSDTMTEGVVAEWHKKVGDNIESGELLAEIETDKATMEFESFQEGVLLHIGVEKGQTAPVDSILAILGEKGEDVAKLLKEEKASEAESVEKEDSKPAPTPKPIPAEVKPQPSVSPAPSVPTPTVSSNKSFPSLDSLNSLETKASPLAKKLAEERGINLKFVSGTGTDGRIVKRDIDNFQGSATIQGQESFVDEPVSQMRKVIAQRLAESKFSAPHFYLTVSINMDNSIEARKAINNAINPSKISFNDLVVKAAAVSLKDHPKVNASWYGDFIRYNEHVHIGVAVAVPDGLVVPVVRFANEQSLPQINIAVKDYAVRARNKKLALDEMEGSTFTISNLGMFGIESFTSIINQPNSAILSVGAIVQKPVVKDGQVIAGNTMKLSMACDHRTVDGATGAQFLQTLKGYIENPVTMLI